VVLDALPRTPNGKVDRRALPEPGGAAAPRHPKVAPPTAQEQVMAQAWAEVLGVERVGLHDSFFALGGHSLLAARLAAHLRQTLKVEVPLRSLFESPTALGREEAQRLRLERTAEILLHVARLTDAEVESLLEEPCAVLDGVGAGEPGP
jgi:hypothetical protein